MRVLSVTAETSLAVALSMIEDWEIVTARDVDEAIARAPGTAVVLVGVGATDEGLAMVERLHGKGIRLPAVVVGDKPGPEEAPAAVVTRPFSLEDLQDAVATALRQPKPGQSPEDFQSLPASAKPERFVGAPAVQREPARPVAPPPSPPAPSAPPPSLEPSVSSSGSPAPAASPAPPRAPEAGETGKRRFGLGRRATEKVPEARPAEAQPAEARPATSGPPTQEKSDLPERIASVARAFGEIDSLLEDLPMLWDLSSMSEALLGEVVQLLEPETASVLVRVGEGFRVFASHGLSRAEVRMVVSETHPLLGEIRTLQAILIAPVDLAYGTVSGIAGARTEAFMAAPVAVEGRCVAIITAGRKNFANKDLDRLDDLAREAAPGLTVAAALERLRRGA